MPMSEGCSFIHWLRMADSLYYKRTHESVFDLPVEECVWQGLFRLGLESEEMAAFLLGDWSLVPPGTVLTTRERGSNCVTDRTLPEERSLYPA